MNNAGPCASFYARFFSHCKFIAHTTSWVVDGFVYLTDWPRLIGHPTRELEGDRCHPVY